MVISYLLEKLIIEKVFKNYLSGNLCRICFTVQIIIPTVLASAISFAKITVKALSVLLLYYRTCQAQTKDYNVASNAYMFLALPPW